MTHASRQEFNALGGRSVLGTDDGIIPKRKGVK